MTEHARDRIRREPLCRPAEAVRGGRCVAQGFLALADAKRRDPGVVARGVCVEVPAIEIPRLRVIALPEPKRGQGRQGLALMESGAALRERFEHGPCLRPERRQLPLFDDRIGLSKVELRLQESHGVRIPCRPLEPVEHTFDAGDRVPLCLEERPHPIADQENEPVPRRIILVGLDSSGGRNSS